MPLSGGQSLIKNGVPLVAEGANMPTTPDAIEALQAGGHHLKDMHMRYGLLIAGTAGTLPIRSG